MQSSRLLKAVQVHFWDNGNQELKWVGVDGTASTMIVSNQIKLMWSTPTSVSSCKVRCVSTILQNQQTLLDGAWIRYEVHSKSTSVRDSLRLFYNSTYSIIVDWWKKLLDQEQFNILAIRILGYEADHKSYTCASYLVLSKVSHKFHLNIWIARDIAENFSTFKGQIRVGISMAQIAEEQEKQFRRQSIFWSTATWLKPL